MAPSRRSGMASPMRAWKENMAAKMSNFGIVRGGYGRAHRHTSSDESSKSDVSPAEASPNHPLFQGACVVGNGRSVLSQSAGDIIDRFDTVLRFNDFQIQGYEKHVGTKTSIWVLSDWTILKLINKYPDRALPILCAIPYKFMGKPYYSARRAEIEAGLTPLQRERVRFISMDAACDLIAGRNFGDRWPSSGLLTIQHMLLELQHSCVFIHGFDFFKLIDGKIHYMEVPCAMPDEDTHTANHNAAEEERICLELMRLGRVRCVV